MPCTVGVRFPLFRPSLRPEGDWNMCMFHVAGIIYACLYFGSSTLVLDLCASVYSLV